MTLQAQRVRPGPCARDWLFDRIAGLQADDPLRPVTVVVANHYLGLALRRDLAQRGYANVRFTVLARLVEPIGAPLLAARGLSPLTTVLEEASVREALRRTDALAAFAGHRRGLSRVSWRRRSSRCRYCREVPVGGPIDGGILEGVVDLLYEDARGDLVVPDHKTDAITASELDERLARYRPQSEAYAVLVEGATRRHVATVVFAFAGLGVWLGIDRDLSVIAQYRATP